MSHSITKAVPLFIVCLLVQGCVGVGVRRMTTKTFQNPTISGIVSIDGLGRGNPSGTNAFVYTSTWLESHWGKPTSVRRTGEGDRGEIWTYKFEHRWVGAGALIVIVPVPILLPVGRDRVIFELRDGEVISGKRKKMEYDAGFAGYLITPVGCEWTAFWGRM